MLRIASALLVVFALLFQGAALARVSSMEHDGCLSFQGGARIDAPAPVAPTHEHCVGCWLGCAEHMPLSPLAIIAFLITRDAEMRLPAPPRLLLTRTIGSPRVRAARAPPSA